MKFITLISALVSVVPAVFGQLTINTPANVVECQPTQLTWTGGQSPYYLSLTPGGQSMASPIKQFPTQNGNSYTWLVDLQAGTNFNVALKDSSGQTAYSDIVTIQLGGDTSCVNTAVQEGSATGGGSPTASGSGSTASSASATSKASGSSSATASSSSSSPAQSNGAGRLTVSTTFGVAGIMGLVGAALF
ncbi:hypothetical protein F5I97DRAFT_1889995 [Phlebopus sp. FC_14]|nr:hypothetical protein F5I97DRAFT_1889995 [Phlebopus sp. FC_14]